MATKILGTSRADTIQRRFNIIGCLSTGKFDIIDIAEETGYSKSTIGTFLNTLSEQSLLDKTFVPERRAPVCYVPSKPSHNEYAINKKGKEYIIQQIEAWKGHPSYSEKIANAIELK